MIEVMPRDNDYHIIFGDGSYSDIIVCGDPFLFFVFLWDGNSTRRCNAHGILVQGGMASILCGRACRHRQLAVSENGELDVKVYMGCDA